MKLSFIDPCRYWNPVRRHSWFLFVQLSLTQQEGHQGRVEVVLSGSGLRSFLQWFLQVSTNSSSSKAKVLHLNSNSVRKGSGFFEDDLIPDRSSACFHVQLRHSSSGQQDTSVVICFAVLKLVNDLIISSRTSSEW